MYELKDLSFIDLCLRGAAMPDDIDDFIEKWHAIEGISTLPAYLGMTDDEYELFVIDPNALAFIVTARREHRPLRSVVGAGSREEPGVAAGPEGGSISKRLKAWLQQRDP